MTFAQELGHGRSSATAARSRVRWEEATRSAARLAFAVAIILSPFRARILTIARPDVPVYADFTDVVLFWSDLAILLTLGLWLASLAVRPRPIATSPRVLAWSATGLVIVAWLGVPGSIDPVNAAVQAYRLCVLVLVALYVRNEVEHPAQLLVPVAAMILVQGVVGVGQVVLQRSIGLPDLGELRLLPSLPVSVVTAADGLRSLRAYGLTDHPNILGGLTAFGMVLVAGVSSTRPGPIRRWSLAIFALGAVLLLATFSRGAALGLAAGLVVLAFMLRGLGSRGAAAWILRLVLVAMLASAPLAVAFLPSVLARTGTQGAIATEVRSVNERVAVAATTVDILMRNPVLGVGIGTLPEAMRAAQPQFAFDYQPSSVVLLDAAAETGLVGGAMLLVLLAAPWLALKRRRSAWTTDLATTSAMLAAVTVVGLFDYYTWTYQAGRIWFWIILGLWATAFSAAAPRGAATSQVASASSASQGSPAASAAPEAAASAPASRASAPGTGDPRGPHAG